MQVLWVTPVNRCYTRCNSKCYVAVHTEVHTQEKIVIKHANAYSQHITIIRTTVFYALGSQHWVSWNPNPSRPGQVAATRFTYLRRLASPPPGTGRHNDT